MTSIVIDDDHVFIIASGLLTPGVLGSHGPCEAVGIPSVIESMVSQGQLRWYIDSSVSSPTILLKPCVVLTLSLPIPFRLYTLPYWSNRLFLIFDILALWRSAVSYTHLTLPTNREV